MRENPRVFWGLVDETQLTRIFKVTETTFVDLFRQGSGFAFFTVGCLVGGAAVWVRIEDTSEITPGIFFALLGAAAFIIAVAAAFFFFDLYAHSKRISDLKELVESIDKVGETRFNALVQMMQAAPRAFEPSPPAQGSEPAN
jgi:glucan phosphoethanolaminetransferase (alkaline phosphatase superfamily)